MARFTRSDIRAIVGEVCNDEIENKLIALHLGVVDPLKDDVARYKADADKLSDVQKELDDLKAAGNEDYKQKYEDEHTALENLKQSIADEKALAEKSSLYRVLLQESGIDPKRIDAVLRVADLTKVEVKDGKLVDSKALAESIKTEWADFVVKPGAKGDKPDTPPADGGEMTKEAFDTMSLSDKMAFANSHPAEYAEFTK